MKKMLIFLVFGILLCGCATTGSKMAIYKQTENKIPIDVTDRLSSSFGVAKIKSSLPPGTAIGGHHDGWAKVKWETYYADGYIGDLAQEHYRNAISEELENAGYKVCGSGSGLFEEDDTWKAQLLIGGRIIENNVNTFAPLAGNYSESGVKIQWEIYDKQARKVIYKKETAGYQKLDGINAQVVYNATRNALRNLLADTEFVNSLIQYEKSPAEFTEKSEPIKFFRKSGKETFKIGDASNAIIAVKTENGHGSGFIINPEGYAVTNYHVIANNNIIDALLKGGKPIEARVIRIDPERDLALIKLRGKEYDYLPLGELKRTKVGMDIYAVGTPIFLDLSNSLSKGIISGIRDEEYLKVTLLQTDASVNPGNSGGPLINMDGEVVGVVALKIKASGIEGLGFAISIDDAKKYLNLQENE